MRGLTLLEPWASLMAMGHKRIETRSWSTQYRGEVAIHASAGTGACRITHEVEALFKRAGMEFPSDWPMTADDYPLGKIIAVGRLIDVSEMTVDIINRVSDREKAFGDWRAGEFVSGKWKPGRFAWIVTSVRRVDPIPWKGSLGLWKVSQELEARIAA